MKIKEKIIIDILEACIIPGITRATNTFENIIKILEKKGYKIESKNK